MTLELRLKWEWWPDVLFVGGIVFCLLFIYAWHFDIWCLIVPVVPVCLFATPLCQTFRRGILRARHAMLGQGEKSPWKTFWSVLWPHMALWVVTLVAYVVLLERQFFRRGDIGQAIISAPTVGLVLLMVGSCFLWAPMCKKCWTLALLILFTPLLLGVLLCGAGWFVMALFGMGGYLGVGYVIVPPLIASIGLLIGAIAILVRAWRKGDAWFQRPAT